MTTEPSISLAAGEPAGVRESEGPTPLIGCTHCGLVQRLPPAPQDPAPGDRLLCARCHGTVRHSSRACASGASIALAFSLAALILYIPAMWLPVMSITKLGHTRAANIPRGIVELFHDGQYAIALIVLVCSIVAPFGKIAGMIGVCAGERWLHRTHRHHAYRFIEFIGKWGMIDVLLVAILVAVVKLGDWVDVEAGGGALAFAGVVVFSLLASAVFDPRSIWEDQTP